MTSKRRIKKATKKASKLAESVVGERVERIATTLADAVQQRAGVLASAARTLTKTGTQRLESLSGKVAKVMKRHPLATAGLGAAIALLGMRRLIGG